MRAEKQFLTKEYATRLNASPFFIVIGYQGLKVAHLTDCASVCKRRARKFMS